MQMPHLSLQKDRFMALMQARNKQVILFGQPEMLHNCDRCMRIYKDGDGVLRLVASFAWSCEAVRSSIWHIHSDDLWCVIFSLCFFGSIDNDAVLAAVGLDDDAMAEGAGM